MSDQDIFDKDGNKIVADPVAPVTPPAPPANLFADQLTGIKNADGTPKYDSVPKALEALGASQQHIATLEAEAATSSTELATLRAEVAKHDGVEEVIARLAAQNEDLQVQETPAPAVVDNEAVLAMVRNALSADQAAAVANENVAKVQQAIIAKYGEKASEVLAAKAQELGTTLEGMKKLSADSPAIVLALFGGVPTSPNNPVSTSMALVPGPAAPDAVEPPQKSLLMGASSQDQMDYMRKIRDEVYAKHGVETPT